MDTTSYLETINKDEDARNHTQQIVNRAWSYAHVLRDDGLSYMGYTEQITSLLFLKMADERTKPPYNQNPIVPHEYGWQSDRACLARYSREHAPRYRTPPISAG